MSARIPHSHGHRLADTGRGLVALAGVAVLVVGIPAALTALVGSPLPAHVPTVSSVTRALGNHDVPDSFVVKTLAVVCWLVWFELVTSLVIEAFAYARGRRARALPLAGGLQRAAARLVAGVALLGALVATRHAPTPAAVAGGPLAPLGQSSTLVAADVAWTQPVPDPGPAPPPAAVAPVAYEVQRRDTLWDIAERHLGDPFRWHEIFDLNQGRPQADGTCLTDPDLIHAGWQLVLPADATGLAAPVPEAPAPAAPAAPAATPTTLPPGGDGAAGGGMVLLDDDDMGGDVTLVGGERSRGAGAGAGVAAAAGGDGMVLLPAGALDDGLDGPVSPARPELADGGARDELAGRAGPPVSIGGPRPAAPDHD
jgi:LysM domain